MDTPLPNIKYLTSKNINKKLWDECLQKSPVGIIYAKSWFLDNLHYEWEGVVDEQFDEKGNLYYASVMPVQIHQKWGIRYVTQDAFAHELGVFSIYPEISQQYVLKFIENAFKPYSYVAKYIFHTKHQYIPQLFETVKTHTTYHLKLDEKYEKLFQRYREDRRWNIRKAQRNKLVVRKSANFDRLIALFKENVAHKIEGIEEYQYETLKKLYHKSLEKGCSWLIEVVNLENEILSMGWALIDNQKIIYMFSASNSVGLKQGAATLALDALIKEYSNTDYILDFEGGDNPNIGDFYKSFGGVACNYYEVNINRLPKWLNLVRDFYRKHIKQLT
ncbi:MAG: hypothetical protein OHK0038_00990 [Flammeovirgaceae bacterium]